MIGEYLLILESFMEEPCMCNERGWNAYIVLKPFHETPCPARGRGCTQLRSSSLLHFILLPSILKTHMTIFHVIFKLHAFKE